VATDGTNFAAYGLSDPFRGYAKRSNNNASDTDKVSNDFIIDVWNVMDQAGNLLIKKHKDYGPTNISLSPGGPLNGLRVRMHDKLARINHLIDKTPVTFFSLEMSKADIISRLLGIETGIGMTKIMRHEFNDTTEVDKFTKARDRLIKSNLKIYSKTNSLDGVILAMTRDILRNKTKVFAIDYIQLVRAKGKSEYEQITEASQRLQTFARETGCTIIVLSQVSNEHAKDQNQEVHGTKGGGSLPASVDLAIELFNEDKKEERDQKAASGEALAVKAIIKKNRHGRCGYVKLDFTPWNGQFYESTDWDI